MNEKCYLVTGKVNAAIYDLNTGNLYQISEEAKKLLHRALNYNDDNFTSEETTFLQKLIDLYLITPNPVATQDITSLRVCPEIDFVWIELTTHCNLRCIHCYDEAESDTICSSNMSLENFSYAIKQLEELGVKKIQLIGGEPFVFNNRIFQYLDKVVGRFEYIEIFTNGTLIKDEWLPYLRDNNIRIALSVYSYNEADHDKVTTVAGSWRKTNAVIKKLHNYGITYRVKNVLMKDINLGVRKTELYQLSPKKDIVRLTGRANVKLLTKNLLKQKLITEDRFCYTISEGLVRKCISGHNCFSRRLYISHDLELYPCVMERRISHGNLKNADIKTLLKNDILSFSKEKINECKNCEFRYCCFDCRPDANGRSIDEKPWYCTYIPEKGIWENPDNFIENILK